MCARLGAELHVLRDHCVEEFVPALEARVERAHRIARRLRELRDRERIELAFLEKLEGRGDQRVVGLAAPRLLDPAARARERHRRVDVAPHCVFVAHRVPLNASKLAVAYGSGPRDGGCDTEYRTDVLSSRRRRTRRSSATPTRRSRRRRRGLRLLACGTAVSISEPQACRESCPRLLPPLQINRLAAHGGLASSMHSPSAIRRGTDRSRIACPLQEEECRRTCG